MRLAAVGDLLLTTTPDGTPLRAAEALAAGLALLWRGYDCVLANLECTVEAGAGVVPTEPRVIVPPETIRAVLASGITVVTLANNHAFDGLEAGFRKLRGLLDEMGVAHFGAGETRAEAAAPAFVEVRGLRLAFIGAVDERSGPNRFAGPESPGVAPLDVERLATDVRQLREEVDHVIVSLHWGEERLPIPSPRQVGNARALAEAGASLVLGHHPHVLQGFEVHEGVPIAYSLGNFVADDVPFTSGDRIVWDRRGRTGLLVEATLGPDGVCEARPRPVVDSGRTVTFDPSGIGDRMVGRAGRALARGVTLGRYRRAYFWVTTMRPIFAHFRWSRLKTLRWSKIRRALASLVRAGRAE